MRHAAASRAAMQKKHEKRPLVFAKIRSLVKNLLLSVAVIVVSFELLAWATIETKLIPADAPSYEWPTFVPFWDQLDKKFSNWHSPNARYVHVNSCYNVTYRSNRHGMRDRDRTVTADSKAHRVPGRLIRGRLRPRAGRPSLGPVGGKDLCAASELRRLGKFRPDPIFSALSNARQKIRSFERSCPTPAGQ